MSTYKWKYSVRLAEMKLKYNDNLYKATRQTINDYCFSLLSSTIRTPKTQKFLVTRYKNKCLQRYHRSGIPCLICIRTTYRNDFIYTGSCCIKL